MEYYSDDENDLDRIVEAGVDSNNESNDDEAIEDNSHNHGEQIFNPTTNINYGF